MNIIIKLLKKEKMKEKLFENSYSVKKNKSVTLK